MSPNAIPQFAYVVVAIVLLLVLGASSPKFAGALLIVLVIGMVYAGYKRNNSSFS